MVTIDNNLSRFEKKNSNLSQIKVDEVLGLVCHVAAEVPSHDGMPCRVVLLVELFLDERGDVLLDVEFLHGLCGTLNGVILHVF